MARLELHDVSLTFRVRKEKRTTLKDFFLAGGFLRAREPVMEVQALRNIDLRFNKGDRIGIIGHNGAGKSTLLKTLAGIYPPTTGKRVVSGKISSLFEMNLGFELEATGWENIAYRSYLQGETPSTVCEKRESIAEFSELGDFLQMPIRYYSAGMVVRLAFSIATTIHPEILLVDESIGAGDAAFQDKARTRMLQVMDEAHLMVVVSHDIATLTQVCDQLIWMDHGTIKRRGPADEVSQEYNEWVGSLIQQQHQAAAA